MTDPTISPPATPASAGDRELPPVETVVVDELRGHIVLHGAPEREGARDVTFVDLGPVLHLWSYQGCAIDPARARDLADALRWWAARADRRATT